MAHNTLATAYLADDFGAPVTVSENAGDTSVRPFKFTAPAPAGGNMATNDLIKLAIIPGSSGIVLLDIFLALGDLDGGAALTFDLGDSGNFSRFATSITVGQAGGVWSSQAAAGGTIVVGTLPATYKTNGAATDGRHGDSDLVLKVRLQGNPAVAGVITGFMRYACLDALQFVYP